MENEITKRSLLKVYKYTNSNNSINFLEKMILSKTTLSSKGGQYAD